MLDKKGRFRCPPRPPRRTQRPSPLLSPVPALLLADPDLLIRGSSPDPSISRFNRRCVGCALVIHCSHILFPLSNMCLAGAPACALPSPPLPSQLPAARRPEVPSCLGIGASPCRRAAGRCDGGFRRGRCSDGRYGGQGGEGTPQISGVILQKLPIPKSSKSECLYTPSVCSGLITKFCPCPHFPPFSFSQTFLFPPFLPPLGLLVLPGPTHSHSSPLRLQPTPVAERRS